MLFFDSQVLSEYHLIFTVFFLKLKVLNDGKNQYFSFISSIRIII